MVLAAEKTRRESGARLVDQLRSEKINILGDFNCPLNGKANLPHNSGGTGIRRQAFTCGLKIC